jgi:hypothetical protein
MLSVARGTSSVGIQCVLRRLSFLPSSPKEHYLATHVRTTGAYSQRCANWRRDPRFSLGTCGGLYIGSISLIPSYEPLTRVDIISLSGTPVRAVAPRGLEHERF